MTMERWLNLDQVAEALAISAHEVGELLEDGLPFAELPGGQRRVLADDLNVYLESRKTSAAAAPPVRTGPGASGTLFTATRVLSRPPALSQVEAGGEFEFRWPDGKVEQYARTWVVQARLGSRSFDVRHAIGTRFAYERDRVRSATFVEGRPMVEGVEADDYGSTRALVSRLTRGSGNKLITPSDPVYLDYADFEVVLHSDEIVAKRSPRRVALKIVEDDINAWVTHAMVRARQKKWQV